MLQQFNWRQQEANEQVFKLTQFIDQRKGVLHIVINILVILE